MNWGPSGRPLVMKRGSGSKCCSISARLLAARVIAALRFAVMNRGVSRIFGDVGSLGVASPEASMLRASGCVVRVGASMGAGKVMIVGITGVTFSFAGVGILGPAGGLAGARAGVLVAVDRIAGVEAVAVVEGEHSGDAMCS